MSLEDFLEEAAETEEFRDLTEDTEENRPLENRVAAAIAAWYETDAVADIGVYRSHDRLYIDAVPYPVCILP